jgi:hypothetical protein
VRRDTCLPATIAGFVTKSSRGEQLLASPPSLVHSEHTTPSAACPFQFLVYYSVFCLFLRGRDQSVQRAMLVYPRGGCGNTVCHLFAHLHLPSKFGACV